MTEKVGLVKNPLTVIAIFAGIAEVSGTLVLPFISETNQITFIYFLIIFPSILVILFFLTLNYNNKALYAPSDFNNEENYIKIFKYDISKQENVQIEVSQDELLKILNDSINEFKNLNDEKFQKLEIEIKNLKSKNLSRDFEAQKENVDSVAKYEDFEEVYEDYDEEELINISNFKGADKFVRHFSRKGYNAEIYEYNEDSFLSYKENKAIWLGNKFQFKLAKEVILKAKEDYPHLQYIDLSNYKQKPPQYVHFMLYIGGATSTAIEKGLKPMKESDWESIKTMTTLEELHDLVKRLQ